MNWFKSKEEADKSIQDTIYQGMVSEADGIDLRIEMNRILYGGPSSKPKGHWVIVRHFDRDIPSPHFNRYTKEGVGGPKYSYNDQLVRTRSTPYGNDKIENEKPSTLSMNTFTYYLEYNVKITLDDTIYELDTVDHTTQPSNYNLVEKYDVLRVNPRRLENGNIQFYEVICKLNNIKY